MHISGIFIGFHLAYKNYDLKVNINNIYNKLCYFRRVLLMNNPNFTCYSGIFLGYFPNKGIRGDCGAGAPE
jgi:hypothetical protein